MTTRTWTTRLGTAAYVIVAMAFLVGAVTKYLPGETFFGPPYSVKFAEWGYPSWFRFVVGTIELICAALLVIPDRRTRFAGSATLVLLLTGAVTTHIVNQDPLSQSTAAPVNLVIVAVIALANWPADWRDLLRPAGKSSRSRRADSGGRPVVKV
ncbi:DoxX family protein [Saccharomonospora sp. NPDC006951]